MPPQLQNGNSSVRTRGNSTQALTISREKKTSAKPMARPYEAHDRQHDNKNSGNSHKHPQHLQGDLRVAYNDQSMNKSNSNGFDQVVDNNDLHSTSGGSAENSAATPSSVYMPSSVALSRDNMSDLSGISGGTNRGSSSHAIPAQILDPKSLMKPWKQAYNLSNIPPECNKNKALCCRTGQNIVCGDDRFAKDGPNIWVAQNDVVEIFDNLESSLGLDRFQILSGKHDRIPVMILLMAPSKQRYELMQIWVDRTIDSIRDLVQILQHKLPGKWKQAYDGLFQVRGRRFTQLINIIRLAKYDIQPHEVLVAKPWSMAAKMSIAVAGSAIRHLTRIGVIVTDYYDGSYDDKERIGYQKQQLRNEDAPLLLSKHAQDRTYFPEGILDHRHALQFITFSPPFESPDDNNTQAKIGNLELDSNPAPTNFSTFPDISSTSKSISEYQYDACSSLLRCNNTNKRNPRKLAFGVRRAIFGIVHRRQKSSSYFSRRDYGSNLVEKNNFLESDSSGKTNSRQKSKREAQQEHESRSNCGPVGCFLKFSCLRISSIEMDKQTRDVVGNSKPSPQTSMTSLSEEEEKRWLACSMKPIDEDQSLASGSIVSMSAPLLLPT